MLEDTEDTTLNLSRGISLETGQSRIRSDNRLQDEKGEREGRKDGRAMDSHFADGGGREGGIR